MEVVRLDLSIEALRKCYVGKDEDEKHILDKSKIDDLQFLFATNRILQAIQNKELTEEEFIERLTKESE